jgi:hypothetical protein
VLRLEQALLLADAASHIGRLATVSSRHLREVTALPTEAVTHFHSELTKATKPRTRRRQHSRRRT